MRKQRCLTLLSIIISTTTIIILFSITASQKKDVIENIQNMGADIFGLLIYNKMDMRDTVTYEDLLMIKRRCKQVRRVAMTSYPKDFANRIRIIEGNKKREIPDEGFGVLPYLTYYTPFLFGTVPDYIGIMNSRLAQGRFINDLDIKMKRRVCVLGYDTYLRCGGKSAIGKQIELYVVPVDEEGNQIPGPGKDQMPEFFYLPEKFTIIGGLERLLILPTSAMYWMNMDIKSFLPGGESPGGKTPFMGGRIMDHNMSIIIPYTTLKEIMQVDEIFNFIFIQVKMNMEKTISDPDKIVLNQEKGLINVHKRVEKEAFEIINVLKGKYGDDKKIHIFSHGRLIDELEKQTRQMNTFIISIGIFTLITSIVGILSIMLLSVISRTTEIGIRRAVGARKKDIFLQFLTEALILSGKGGVIGIILGVLGAYAIARYASWEVVIPIYSIFLGLCMPIIIAIVGGGYPAMRAANIHPAVAVKYE